MFLDLQAGIGRDRGIQRASMTAKRVEGEVERIQVVGSRKPAADHGLREGKDGERQGA